MHGPTYETQLCTELCALLDELVPRLSPETRRRAHRTAETHGDDWNDVGIGGLMSVLVYASGQLGEHNRFLPGEYARVTAVIDATLKYFGVL